VAAHLTGPAEHTAPGCIERMQELARACLAGPPGRLARVEQVA
jgi:hypothetical protein